MPAALARLVLAAALSFVVVHHARASRPTSPPRPRSQRIPKLEGDFADPFVLFSGGRYYAFATGVGGAHVQAAVSNDLASWTRLPDALPALPAWAAQRQDLTWAPSVLARGESYVLYYTTRDAASGFQCISRATAPGPGGPYVDRSTKPLVCQVEAQAQLCGSIDPSPFVDTDGTPYLLWKSDENAAECRTSPRLWAQRLSNDGLDLLGAPTALLARDRPWEGDIIEGPSMVRRNGRYYLFYSANWYASGNYAIGYATCSSLSAPCEKQSVGAPFVGSARDALGPGGQEVFTGADGELWLAYHAWTAPHTDYESGGARSLRLAPLEFSPDGAPRPFQPR